MSFDNVHIELEAEVEPGGRRRVDVLHYINHVWIDRFHMLHGDFIVDARIPEAVTQSIIVPRNSILHSNAGGSTATWQQIMIWINRAGNSEEPHGQIDLNGIVAQYMPLNRRADCNYKANSWWYAGRLWGALSWETADRGDASLPDTEWTLPQLAAIVAIQTAQCVVYKIPCTLTTRWDGGGIGWHRLFPEWSKWTGKTCPGDARIRQMPWILDQVAQRVAQYNEITGATCPGT